MLEKSWYTVGMSRSAPMKILVVDDETAIVQSLVALFEGEGHQCIGATSAGEALRECSRERFDCLVLDAQLGTTSGLAVAERVGKTPMRPRFILILSAHRPEEFAVPLRTGMIEAYLQKPASNEALLERVGWARETKGSIW
jgi:DNA-binding response OmpR family regulator